MVRGRERTCTRELGSLSGNGYIAVKEGRVGPITEWECEGEVS